MYLSYASYAIDIPEFIIIVNDFDRSVIFL